MISNKEKPHSIIRKPITTDDFVDRVKAEIPSQARNISTSSKQIQFLICESCFWCALLLSQIPDYAAIFELAYLQIEKNMLLSASIGYTDRRVSCIKDYIW